ncbi:MAG: trypsin-like peptidase domain-containing protein [Pseudomonadota bacterium]
MRAAYLPIALLLFFVPARAHADVADALQSVVSILPERPTGRAVRPGANRGQVPEASGIVVGRDGYIATARHVIEAVKRIEVRLADGRVLPGRLIGADAATDIALLKVDENLKPFADAPAPRLALPVCVIGNAYGLGLSVSCGVVSAVDVSHARFNAIEDFVQTDAAANPGSSGGALVDNNGRLVGMVSAIFAAKSDTNIGINFAVSARLLRRVVNDLKDVGRVDYVRAGWQLGALSRRELQTSAGARILDLDPEGPASLAGLQRGDVIRAINGRSVRAPRGAMAALALLQSGQTAEVVFSRAAQSNTATLAFKKRDERVAVAAKPSAGANRDTDCLHPVAVCLARQAVFPIESFDPLASAVRIAPDLLVTNRHAIGARETANVMTPLGPREGRVIASTYRGDLALIQVEGLPADGLIFDPAERTTTRLGASLFVVGADIARRQIRVFRPGKLMRTAEPTAPLGRLHVSSQMQPGVSGGALIDSKGQLIGIAVGGGEGRNEALPASHVTRLLNGRQSPGSVERHRALGQSLEACATHLDKAERSRGGRNASKDTVRAIAQTCAAGNNLGQLLRAARVLAFAREHLASLNLAEAAVAQVPNSANARVSLLVSLQLARRFKQMLPHARWIMKALPRDPQAMRFGIQSGVWAGDRNLAEAAYRQLKSINPQQAAAARRFIDNPPPAPRPR